MLARRIHDALEAHYRRYNRRRFVSPDPLELLYPYDDPADARLKLAAYHERYNVARPHWALVAANPATAPARILTHYEVYVKGYAVNPPSWSRWVGWLSEADQAQAAQPPNRPAPKTSA